MAHAETQPSAVYVVTDRRRDGRRRIVLEVTDPATARAVAERLREAGADAEVHLLSSVMDEAEIEARAE